MRETILLALLISPDNQFTSSIGKFHNPALPFNKMRCRNLLTIDDTISRRTAASLGELKGFALLLQREAEDGKILLCGKPLRPAQFIHISTRYIQLTQSMYLIRQCIVTL